jgi:hypothetical protein
MSQIRLAQGQVGQNIQRELQQLGWWNSLDSYRRSLCKMVAA